MKTGIDVEISPLAFIKRPELAKIGSHVSIDPFTVITTQLELGDYIHIAPHCTIIGGAKSKLVMGDFAGIAAGARVICASDDFRANKLLNPLVPEEYRSVIYSTITLGRFATLGTNTVVTPGVTIGEGVTVLACALVSKDLEPWGVYGGTPLRRQGERDRDAVLRCADEFLRKKAKE